MESALGPSDMTFRMSVPILPRNWLHMALSPYFLIGPSDCSSHCLVMRFLLLTLRSNLRYPWGSCSSLIKVLSHAHWPLNPNSLAERVLRSPTWLSVSEHGGSTLAP